MAYNIIQPPFTLKFREMSKAELRDYFQWFLSMIPERINELVDTVTRAPGFETWRPDMTPNSLETLGDWLTGQVETRPRTGEELAQIEDRSPYPIQVTGNELTDRTFSLVVDTGMYLSQVFLHNYPALEWDQEFGDKKFVDYGQPVLIEFGPAPFNPVRMMVTLAYGLVDRTWGGRRLREIYNIWGKLVRIKA